MSSPGAGPEVQFTGTIERFTFRNPDTGFAVVRIAGDGAEGTITAVGQLAQLGEGQRVRLSGRRIEHPRFGTQIEVESAEAVAPSTLQGIEAYLSSKLVKGIGPATAKRIVAKFGQDTLRVIEEEPQRLRGIKGFSDKRIEELSAAIAARKEVQGVMVFLRANGLGLGLATRIVKRYGKNASALIQANPYRLADEVLGIGFRTADRLAGQMGIAPEAPERLAAAMVHVLGLAAKEGHCYLPEEELVARTAELLQCDEAPLRHELPELAASHQVIRQLPPGPVLLHEDPRPVVYPQALHQAETGTALALHRLLLRKGPRVRIKAPQAVQWFEQKGRVQLPEGQRDALLRALSEPVSVITGGPGVGKTTIVRALAEIFAKAKLRLLLAAPTGRAAKRLEEATGHAASTLHRLLEFTPGLHRFQRGPELPLEGDMLVVDEASMLDVQLAYNLLRAVPPTMALVLVGDQNQLPPVGPGAVLADVIGSGRVAVTALTEIFRQQKGSAIVSNAHAILRGEVPEGGGEGSDFYLVQARDGAHARLLIRELVTQRIPRAFGLHPMDDIQVLCPMYRGEAGADSLNRDLQDVLNPGAAEVERSGKTYRVGDKVLQVKNDYERGVFNGDCGRIADLDVGAARLSVLFPEGRQDYGFEELDQLVPAYAISVHRSQGSEYPAVVMPVLTEHFLMLKRTLLYTAVTRGKRLVVLVGTRKAMEIAVKSHDEGGRYTGLKERLRDQIRGDGVHPERWVAPVDG